MIFYFLLHIIASVFVAYWGRESRLGFWGLLVASFLITPLLVFIILVLFGRRFGSE
ncbi:hypothetical protein [Kordiimonas pumila]|uniref:Uncharacterized protein n=1 Tax=Kordiimonas pumila TaxID=2161677 RepID=A0ABV7D2Z2_9PROT|nr:hypothetical protein [Kordiimonas pumila]